MWQKLLSTLLILVISAIPVTIVIFQHAIKATADLTPKQNFEFYNSVAPNTLFFGITLALISLSDSFEFRINTNKEHYHSSLFVTKAIPLVQFFVVIFLTISLMLYYQLIIFVSKHDAVTSNPTIIENVRLIFRCSAYCAFAIGNLYIVHTMLARDLMTNAELFDE
ncbi:MAG: hypothetical protein R3D31_04775 [Hyphomicrobiaceae bacterium]